MRWRLCEGVSRTTGDAPRCSLYRCDEMHATTSTGPRSHISLMTAAGRWSKSSARRWSKTQQRRCSSSKIARSLLGEAQTPGSASHTLTKPNATRSAGPPEVEPPTHEPAPQARTARFRPADIALLPTPGNAVRRPPPRLIHRSSCCTRHTNRFASCPAVGSFPRERAQRPWRAMGGRRPTATLWGPGGRAGRTREERPWRELGALVFRGTRNGRERRGEEMGHVRSSGSEG